MREAGPARSRRRGDREREPLAALGPARDDGQARLSFELFLVRHGETEWTVNGRHTGKTDIPLTPHGEEEAASLRPKLAGIGFTAVFASQLQRAQRTAELAGIPKFEITPLLNEVDYGEFDGRTSADIHAERPGWELYRDGSPGGETPAEMYERAEAFIAMAAARSGRVIAFSHGHFLRGVAVAWLAIDITNATKFKLDVASISILSETDHGRELARWNAP